MTPRDVLLVDDDVDGRDALSQLLTARGYDVRQAGDGQAALDMIAECMPGYLVLDLEMPVMSGWEVLAALAVSTTRCTLTVVILSATTPSPPGVTCLQKPCVISELLAALGMPGHGPAADPSATRRPP